MWRLRTLGGRQGNCDDTLKPREALIPPPRLHPPLRLKDVHVNKAFPKIAYEGQQLGQQLCGPPHGATARGR